MEHRPYRIMQLASTELLAKIRGSKERDAVSLSVFRRAEYSLQLGGDIGQVSF